MISVACTVCGETKSASEYGQDSRKRNGLKSSCKLCSAEAVRRWRKNNPSRAAQIDKERYYKNPQKRRKYSRDWYSKNKCRARGNNKAWRNENKDKVRADGKEQSKRWRLENPDRARKNARESQKIRRLNGRNRLDDAIRSSVSSSLRRGSKAGRKTFDLLGYSASELRVHLEKKFLLGMSWENYGQWHVDHIVPLSSHLYETPDDAGFKAAWSLDNLQPLWAKENQSKGSKLNWAAPHVNDNVPDLFSAGVSNAA